MSTYLLTGTSRGLGLALTSLLSALPSSKVSKIIATSRSSPTPELSSLISSSAGRITHVKIDVSDEKSVKEAVPIVEKILRDGDEDGEVVEDKKSKRGLDVLINNAGILNMTEGGIEKMAELEETFKSNVMSVHYMTRAFLPLLRLGKEKKVVNMFVLFSLPFPLPFSSPFLFSHLPK